LEDEVVRGSMVAREINLEENRVYMPTLMIQETFFSLPIVVAPTVQDTIMTIPVVSSPVEIMNEEEEPVI